LLNDPLVIHLAGLWAQRTLASPHASDCQRIDRLFEAAFSRPPTDSELSQCLDFVRDRQRTAGPDGELAAWSDLCHALINVKSFIYLD
jgi:hypothetical protein